MVKIKIIPAQVQELPKGAFEDTINAPEFVGVVPATPVSKVSEDRRGSHFAYRLGLGLNYLTGKADCGIRSGSQLTVMKAEHTSSPASFASASSSFTIVPPLGSATSTSMTERTFASDDRRYFPENATYGVADLQPLKVLGAGCFGTVYMAKDRLTGKDLAVKVTEELCLDEQRALRRVEGCKAFLQLHASWRDESHCFLATDYCANGDLRSEVDRQGKLSEAYAKVLIAELLLALDELHGLGMVHRDVKPENILFDSEGHIVLADFGLVRDLKDSEVASPPDPNNDIPAGCTRSDCGTLDYMAPEMINKEPYSYGVDFWAMGVLLYFLLTGRLPFGNGLSDYPPIVMAAMILVKDPTFEDSDLVSPVARDFIQSVLQKDRSSRLSVDEMKAHAFFADVDWIAIAARTNMPLIVPVPYKLRSDGEDLDIPSGNALAPREDLYPDFTYTSPLLSEARRAPNHVGHLSAVCLDVSSTKETTNTSHAFTGIRSLFKRHRERRKKRQAPNNPSCIVATATVSLTVTEAVSSPGSTPSIFSLKAFHAPSPPKDDISREPLDSLRRDPPLHVIHGSPSSLEPPGFWSSSVSTKSPSCEDHLHSLRRDPPLHTMFKAPDYADDYPQPGHKELKPSHLTDRRSLSPSLLSPDVSRQMHHLQEQSTPGVVKKIKQCVRRIARASEGPKHNVY